MMTVHKLSAGDGYTYLTRQVASADQHRTRGQDLAGYYTATGAPPGRWMGHGAADLAISGEVSEAQMVALFGKGLHPDAVSIVAAEEALGASPREASQAASLGRPFPFYAGNPRGTSRSAERVGCQYAIRLLRDGWPRCRRRHPSPDGVSAGRLLDLRGQRSLASRP